MSEYEVLEVEAQGVKMNVTRFGSGKKTLIIIPGLSLKPVSQSAGFIAVQYKKACDKYTVYVFDRKKEPENGYTVRQMASDTALVMKKLGLSDAYVFGASQGGMILQFLMIDYPELVKAAVISSSMARSTPMSEKVTKNWVRLAKAHKKRALNHDCFLRIYSPAYIEKYKKSMDALENIGEESELDSFAVLAEACSGFSAYEELGKVNCPVLVIGSRCDNVVSVKGSEEIAEALGCEMFIYDGYSHAVYDEASDHLDRILDFFAEYQ